MTCPNEIREAAYNLNANGADPVSVPDTKISNQSGGYWCEFTNVDGEIHRFVVDHGIFGRLPTEPELWSAGRADLSYAIRLHGGPEAVSARLGLRYMHPPKLSHGHWRDFMQVGSMIRQFVTESQLDGRMPFSRELKAAGLRSLALAVNRYGGFEFMANWLDYRYEHRPTVKKTNTDRK